MDWEQGQPEQRRFSRFTDQHGRKYGGVIEIKTGLPCSPIYPMYQAPLDVPQEMIRYDAVEPNLIVIDYEKWVKEREQALTMWERKLVRIAQDTYGDRAGDVLKKPTPELLRLAGPKPYPTQPVLASSSGNKWVLGESPHRPPWATPELFPDLEEKGNKRKSRSTVKDRLEELREQFPDVEIDDEALDDEGDQIPKE